MESQPDLDIKLLGTFRLTYRGQLVRNVLTKRLIALLAYLLIHRKEIISRQRLALLLWPDTSDSQARTNLRRLLHQLREAFPPINDYLRSEPTDLSWSHIVPYRLDIAEFEMTVGQARDIPDLQMAVDLYQGDLLPDLYEDWVQYERERLGRLYEDLLVRLAGLEEEKGQYQSGIRAGQRLLQHDPLREETYRLLMRLHAKLGDRTGVRRIYNTCKAVLRRELEVGPDPETEDAYRIWSQPISSLPSKSVQITTSLPLRKTNLPAMLDTLLGRGEDVEQVKTLVITKRLATLTGFGGVGKTRLALASAAELQAEYYNGIYWIDLAQLENSALIPQMFADVLGVQVDNRSSLKDRLVEFIADKRILLVVDNCEHLIEGVGRFMEQLLRTCQEIHILATSRISLRIPGETIFQVHPLPVPALPSETSDEPKRRIPLLQQNSSVKLFIDRARSILPTFALNEENLDAVAQICRQLDGIPLALELAAGRIRVLDPTEIVKRLDHAFLLLGGGKNSLPRHQTLHATLDWSYALLSEQEQILFRRLAVFAGPFALEDVETVAQGEGLPSTEVLERLAGLVDHSLVAVERVNDERYYRLHEVTRQYALEMLRSTGEDEIFRDCHLSYFCSLAEQAEPFLRNQQQLRWLKKLDQQTANLRAAIEWGAQQQEKKVLELALRLVGALFDYWFKKGRFVEGLNWTESLIAASKQISIHPGVMGKALNAAAGFSIILGDLKKAQAYTEEGLIACEWAEDISGRAISFLHFGWIAARTGNGQQAVHYYKTGLDLARKANNDWLMSLFFDDLGARLRIDEDYQSARNFLLEEIAICRQLGDRFGMASATVNLGYLAFKTNDLQQAALFSQEGYTYSQEIGDISLLAFSLQLQARIASLQNHPEEAKNLWLESLTIFWETRSLDETLGVIEELAVSASFQDDPARSVCLLGACQSMRQKNNLRLRPKILRAVDHLRTEMGEPAFTQAWEEGQKLTIEEALHLVGEMSSNEKEI